MNNHSLINVRIIAKQHYHYQQEDTLNSNQSYETCNSNSREHNFSLLSRYRRRMLYVFTGLGNIMYSVVRKYSYRSKYGFLNLFMIIMLIYFIIWLYQEISLYNNINIMFSLPSVPLPVSVYSSKNIIYHNHPISQYRPINQFICTDRYTIQSIAKSPIITILTPTKNPRPELLLTWESIKQQSLQLWKWIIINDYSDNEESIQLMNNLVSSDSRIQLVHNNLSPGLNFGRQFGLQFIDTPFFGYMDDDDLFELTFFEKAIWLMISVETVHIVASHEIDFGDLNQTWTKGLHDGLANYYDNRVIGASCMLRSAPVLSTTCTFDPNLTEGGEDWDFWMCLAKNGIWGHTIPEFLFWYRKNPQNFRRKRWSNLFGSSFEGVKTYIQEKHSNLLTNGIQIPIPSISTVLEPNNWTLPFSNMLSTSNVKGSILLVMPIATMGGADLAFFRLLRHFAESGYRVTIVLTMYKPPLSTSLLSEFMKYTHDVHILPLLLRLVDWPRYFIYLIQSRSISTIITTNSQAFSQLLPSLIEYIPKSVLLMDYIHHIEHEWMHGGHARISLLNGRYIHRTLTASNNVRDWLINQGRHPDSVSTVYVGLDIELFNPPQTIIEKQNLKLNFFSEYSVNKNINTILIISVARIVPDKRPLLAIKTIERLKYLVSIYNTEKFINLDFHFIIAGDGPLLSILKEEIIQLQLQSDITIIGAISDEQRYKLLSSADIYFLPSETEGLSISIAEAMLMKLAVVATNSGGLPELVINGTGILIDAPVSYNKIQENLNIDNYSSALFNLLINNKLRTQYGNSGYLHVQSFYNARINMKRIEIQEIPLGLEFKAKYFDSGDINIIRTLGPNPNTNYALSLLIHENGIESDIHYNAKMLLGPPRTGVGLEFQKVCGESTDEMTEWITGIHNSLDCTSNRKMDQRILEKAFYRSAKRQCFHWCIFDISTTTTNNLGWYFNGKCFTPFDDRVPEHECIVKFLNQKPTV